MRSYFLSTALILVLSVDFASAQEKSQIENLEERVKRNEENIQSAFDTRDVHQSRLGENGKLISKNEEEIHKTRRVLLGDENYRSLDGDFSTNAFNLVKRVKALETEKGFTFDRGGLDPNHGKKGEKGDPGERGPRGFRGMRGPKGEKGDTGERGPEGPQGLRGFAGERGLPGPRGEKGEKGDSGVDAFARDTLANVQRDLGRMDLDVSGMHEYLKDIQKTQGQIFALQNALAGIHYTFADGDRRAVSGALGFHNAGSAAALAVGLAVKVRENFTIQGSVGIERSVRHVGGNLSVSHSF